MNRNHYRNHLETIPLTIRGAGLAKVQEEKFFSFINSIKGSSIIYRGVDGRYLKKRYNTDANDVPLLSDLLFLYGDKGKAFCEEFKFDNNTNNTERICFMSILSKLKETFTNRNSNSDSVNINLNKFYIDNNIPIKKLISTDENEWCEKIASFPEDTKIAIKDYYISFLHSIEKAGYGKYSYFLSATKCRKKADFFRHHDVNRGIIMVGWTNEKGLKCIDGADIKTIVANCGFPTFNTVVYPNQHEITYKCGLLPHYIIGYYYKDKFEINPYIMDVEDVSVVRKDGLPVNQEPFLRLLSKTNFKSYYNVCDCFYWQI